jgi:hypothetical protein
MAVSEAAKRP